MNHISYASSVSAEGWGVGVVGSVIDEHFLSSMRRVHPSSPSSVQVEANCREQNPFISYQCLFVSYHKIKHACL
jgi:hypothetical protein